MKTYTATQRNLNIIQKAIELGFEIDGNDQFNCICIDAEDYLIDNSEDVIEEQCEVESLGNHGQSVSYNDGMGYDLFTQGEIVHFGDHYFKNEDEKVFHTTLVNSEGTVVKLFFFVGKNEYNQQ